MTPAQKHQLRAAEIQARLAKIAEFPSAQQRAEPIASEVLALQDERIALPDKLRKALEAEGADAALRGEQAYGDGAFAEMSGVAAQASVGQFFENLYEKKPHEGALSELQQHYGMDRNSIPLDLLRSPRMAVTPAPAAVDRTEQPVVLPVFAEGDSAFLSVDMPTVESGDGVFPVLTSRPTVGGPHIDSTAVGETTGAFSAEILQPSRIQASFFYRRTDATRFRGMDSALRAALSAGLSEALDAQVVAQIVTDVTQTAAARADSFESYRARLVYDRIDGRFATMESDLRLLVGMQTLTHMASLFRGATNDISTVESVRRLVSGLKVSPHVAAVANDKQDTIIRRGSRRDMVCPLWRGVHVIFDEVTKANSGEIVLTAIMQFAKKVIRTDGFSRIETQHA